MGKHLKRNVVVGGRRNNVLSVRRASAHFCYSTYRPYPPTPPTACTFYHLRGATYLSGRQRANVTLNTYDNALGWGRTRIPTLPAFAMPSRHRLFLKNLRCRDLRESNMLYCAPGSRAVETAVASMRAALWHTAATYRGYARHSRL